MADDISIAIFLKAPRRGTVKTRLAEQVGTERALGLYRQMVESVVTAARGTSWPITIWFAPDDAANELSGWLGADLTYRPQPDGDIGTRMAAAVRAVPAGAAVLVIGGDIPELTAAHLVLAGHGLASVPVVLGPSADGGYYLIGCRPPVPDLFAGMEWSHGQVLEQTRRRLIAANVAWREVTTLRDVDTAADAHAVGLLTGDDP